MDWLLEPGNNSVNWWGNKNGKSKTRVAQELADYINSKVVREKRKRASVVTKIIRNSIVAHIQSACCAELRSIG